MSHKNKSLAIELAENVADLAETAFGWDSMEAAGSRKEAGLRCIKAEHWDEAKAHLQASLEAYETISGVEDANCTQVRKLIKECDAHIPAFDAAVDAAYRDISRLGLLRSIKAIHRKNSKLNTPASP